MQRTSEFQKLTAKCKSVFSAFVFYWVGCLALLFCFYFAEPCYIALKSIAQQEVDYIPNWRKPKVPKDEQNAADKEKKKEVAGEL